MTQNNITVIRPDTHTHTQFLIDVDKILGYKWTLKIIRQVILYKNNKNVTYHYRTWLEE